jgi:hypothetical protein
MGRWGGGLAIAHKSSLRLVGNSIGDEVFWAEGIEDLWKVLAMYRVFQRDLPVRGAEVEHEGRFIETSLWGR